MTEESKPVDPEASREAIEEVSTAGDISASPEESGDEPDVDADGTNDPDNAAATAGAKKKKSKKKKLKSVLGISSKDESPAASTDASKLPSETLNKLVEMNPALAKEFSGMSRAQQEQAIKKIDVADMLTGLAVGGKNQKDMASYKFWTTQPVPRFDEQSASEEGPIKIIDPDKVPKEPAPLMEGFSWVTMDLTNEKELEEVYELLSGHYVEDDEAMFRFNYSSSFFNWALKSPGWKKEWHIGVRASKSGSSSGKLVAFISGIPVAIRVREKTVKCSEINFLCIHKKLRSKRLAPVLIKEVTRRCYVDGIFQAIYTAGVVVPKPISTCRYFHRSLDWLKLYEVGFSPLPSNSTKARQITKYHLPNHTSSKGLRPMLLKDVDAVQDLLSRYLKRFDLAPEFSREEIEHWLIHKESPNQEQVIWSYVVEDSSTNKITDFFSFYCLESTVIGNKKHGIVRAAYLFYYATETAFEKDALQSNALATRLNMLINDALVLAKKFNFDVFNALTLLDNPLFLEKQKFGGGDGQLHYYLYNYRTSPIPGGTNAKLEADPKYGGGIGVVML